MKKSLSNGVIIWLVLSSGILAFIDPFQTQMAFAQLVNSTSTNSTSTTLTNSTTVNLTNSTLSLTNSTNITTTNSTTTTTNSTTTTEPIVQEPIIIEETTPAPPTLPTGLFSISRYTQPTDSFVDLVKTSYGSNYNLVEDYNIGEATWTSTQPRILKDGVWVNYVLKQYDQKIEIYSNSVGTIIYDLPTCSYSIYENGYNGQNIIPSVSAVASANINGVWQNLEVNDELCSVEVVEDLNGATITATKTFSDTVSINNLVNGTSSVSLFNIEQTFVHEIQFDVNKGIKETFKVWNTDDVELGISQTVHTGESITVGQNTINIAQANGQSFDRAFLEANEAQVFEIANGLNYDFDLGFDSLSNVNIFFDGNYKVNLDYADGGFVNYLEIDPTFSSSSPSLDGMLQTAVITGTSCDYVNLQSSGTYRTQGTNSLYIYGSGANQVCYIPYYIFDTTSISTDAIITDSQFTLDVNSVSTPRNVDILGVDADSTSTDADILSGYNSPTTLVSNDSTFTTVGSNKQVDLTSNGDTYIQNRISLGNEVALMLTFNSMVRDGSVHSIELKTNESTTAVPKPTLEITYSLPTIPKSPTSLVATDGLPIGLSYSVPSDDGYGNSNGAELIGYKVYRTTNANALLELPNNGGTNNGLDFSDNELLLHSESITPETTPDLTDDFSSATAWTFTGSGASLSNGELYINFGATDNDDRGYRDIGTSINGDLI